MRLSHAVMWRAQTPKARRPRGKQLGSWRFRQQESGGVFMTYRHTDIQRVLYYDTPANRINLDGDALLVGSDDANDVRHETLSHRGPHQAIAVAHLVLPCPAGGAGRATAATYWASLLCPKH